MGIRIKSAASGQHSAASINNSVHSGLPANYPPRLLQLGLDKFTKSSQLIENNEYFQCIQLQQTYLDAWSSNYDTTQLCDLLQLDTVNSDDDLEREIFLAMLMSPLPFVFPSHAELASAVRIRKNVVQAARKTSLDFNTTDAAERPAEYWTYHEDTGFTLIPGKSLITALQKATQPEESGQLYSFSCYRATEYVILLAVAQELYSCNPELYAKLQKQWESKAIMSGKFHDVFLREYGSMEQPLPVKYYVPGDRLWFRNPDSHSSDVTGYEGSWVFYLGCGLFTNFWNHKAPYTLTSKCVEIYHWRHGVYQDSSGELQIDESKIAELVKRTLDNPAELAEIMPQMLRLREPKGVYENGGCIDTSREYPRCVCPGTADMSIT